MNVGTYCGCASGAPTKYSRTRARARCRRLLVAAIDSPSLAASSAMVSSSKSRRRHRRSTTRASQPPTVHIPHELLENHGIGKPSKYLQLLFPRKLQSILGSLHPFREPVPHLQLIDVHELNTDVTAVGRTQPFHDVA